MNVNTLHLCVVADPENSAMSRLFLLALLASLASGWDRPLPGPVRAAAAHERGGLNPYHFFSVRHDRRKLEGEEEEDSITHTTHSCGFTRPLALLCPGRGRQEGAC